MKSFLISTLNIKSISMPRHKNPVNFDLDAKNNTGGRDPPLAQVGFRNILVETLNNVRHPCPQPLSSVRLLVSYMVQCLHNVFLSPHCARGGSRPPVKPFSSATQKNKSVPIHHTETNSFSTTHTTTQSISSFTGIKSSPVPHTEIKSIWTTHTRCKSIISTPSLK